MIEEYEQLTKKAEAREEAALDHVKKISAILANEKHDEIIEEKAYVQDTSDILMEVDGNESLKEIESQITNNDVEMEVDKSPQTQTLQLQEPHRLKVNDQTEEKEYKPSIRIQKDKNAMSESPQQQLKSNIKFNKNLHHSNETDYDAIEREEQRRINLFKKRNIHGHASDSQIEQLLYDYTTGSSLNTIEEHDPIILHKPQKQKTKVKKNYDNFETQLDIDEKIKNENFKKFTQKDTRIESINFDEIIKPYCTDFDFDQKIINNNLLNDDLKKIVKFNLFKVDKFIEQTSRKQFDLIKVDDIERDETGENENEIEEFLIENEIVDDKQNDKIKTLFSYNYIEIDEILNRILFKPIQLQCDLVNKFLVNYFLFNLNLDDHLEALRKYVLFENGEFAQTFVDHLCDNFFSINFLSNSIISNERFDFGNLMSPIYINEALNKAKSQVKNCKYIENISIRMNNEKIENLNSTSLNSSASNQNNNNNKFKNILNCLSCLELKYKLDWPLNIIISDSCLKNYNQLFGFLLQIKFVISALNNVWHTLKRYCKLLFFN